MDNRHINNRTETIDSSPPSSPPSPIYIPDSSPPPRRALIKKRIRPLSCSSSSYRASSTSRSRSSNSRERYQAYQIQRMNRNASKRAKKLLFISDNEISADENDPPTISSETPSVSIPPTTSEPATIVNSPTISEAPLITTPEPFTQEPAFEHYLESSVSNNYSTSPKVMPSSTPIPPLTPIPPPTPIPSHPIDLLSSSDLELDTLIPTMHLDPIEYTDTMVTEYTSPTFTQPFYSLPDGSSIQLYPYPTPLPAIPDEGERISHPETNILNATNPDKAEEEERFINELLSPPLTEEERRLQISPAPTEDSFYYETYEPYKSDKIRDHHDSNNVLTRSRFAYSYTFNRFFESYPIQNNVNISSCKTNILHFLTDTKNFDLFLERLMKKVPSQKKSKFQAISQNNISPENIFFETSAFKFTSLTEAAKPIQIIPKLNNCDAVTKFTECVLDEISDPNVTFLLAYVNEHCDSALLVPTFEKRVGTTTNYYYGNHRQTCHNAKAGKEKLDKFIKSKSFMGDFIRHENERGVFSYDSAPMTDEIENKLDFYTKSYFAEMKVVPCSYYGKCIENTRIKYIPSEWRKGDFCFIVPNSRLCNTLKQKSTFPLHSLLTPFKYEFVLNIYNSVINRTLDHRLSEGIYSANDINAYITSEHFFILYKDPAFKIKLLFKLPKTYFENPFYKLKPKKH